MKRINGIILTLALLMVGTLGAWAQHVESGTGMAWNGQAKMDFSFSGGEIKKKEERDNRYFYECDVLVGSVITVSANLVSAPEGIKEIHLSHSFNTSTREEIKKEGKSVKLQYKVESADCFKGIETRAYIYLTGTMVLQIKWNVINKPNTPTSPTTTTPPTQPITIDNCNCDYIRSDIGYYLIDSHIRFNDFYGEVKMRPNWKEDDSYEFVDIDSPIYECYRIKTEEDSGAILGLWDMSTYVMKPETTLIIRTEEDNTTRFELIVGTLWGQIKKMATGKSVECEMSQCVSGISGTIVAWEEKNGVSSVYLFAGKVDVTSKKTKKKQVLQPGQTSSVGKDGKIVVKKFNIEQGAKKFGIPMSEIRNHYSNTTTTATTKRYDVERAMVKYKVTTGTTQGVMAKVFDKYGQQERREMKMGNQTTLQLTQGNNSYSLNTQAKTYTQVTNAELNFLNMNAPVMLKLKLKKKGTAKVLNRECTIYANADTEYYVWKGIVLKKVAHTKKGITTTEATSVELPASVDTKYFNMPAGYRKK